MRNSIVLSGIAMFAVSAPLQADMQTDPPAKAQATQLNLTSEEQFALIASWEGRWQVKETQSLEIVFESTARGNTIIERWETASGLHSMNVYHLNGDTVMATHYCPQGNQPRLESSGTSDGNLRFVFRDVTDLDSGESHTHDLVFSPQTDGSLIRTEIYLSEDGLGDPGRYTLVRDKPAS